MPCKLQCCPKKHFACWLAEGPKTCKRPAGTLRQVHESWQVGLLEGPHHTLVCIYKARATAADVQASQANTENTISDLTDDDGHHGILPLEGQTKSPDFSLKTLAIHLDGFQNQYLKAAMHGPQFRGQRTQRGVSEGLPRSQHGLLPDDAVGLGPHLKSLACGIRHDPVTAQHLDQLLRFVGDGYLSWKNESVYQLYQLYNEEYAKAVKHTKNVHNNWDGTKAHQKYPKTFTKTSPKDPQHIQKASKENSPMSKSFQVTAYFHCQCFFSGREVRAS